MYLTKTGIQMCGYTLQGVDDWLCFFTDADDRWFYFTVECDPLWNVLPRNYRRFALGLEDDTDAQESAECIAAIGLRKLQLGHTLKEVDPEFAPEMSARYL